MEPEKKDVCGIDKEVEDMLASLLECVLSVNEFGSIAVLEKDRAKEWKDKYKNFISTHFIPRAEVIEKCCTTCKKCYHSINETKS